MPLYQHPIQHIFLDKNFIRKVSHLQDGIPGQRECLEYAAVTWELEPGSPTTLVNALTMELLAILRWVCVSVSISASEKSHFCSTSEQKEIEILFSGQFYSLAPEL